MNAQAISKVGLVLRVSSGSQRKDDQDDSVDSQRTAAEKWIASQGWNLDPKHIYDETAEKGWQSGRSKLNDRPYILEMLDAAERREFDAVLFWDASRLGRDRKEAMQLVWKLEDLDMFLCFTKTKDIRTTDNFGDDIVVYLGQSFAEKDWEDFNYKSRDGRFNAFKAGKFSGGSVPPKGYGVDKNDGNRIVVDEETAEPIRRIYEIVSAGASATEAGNVLGPEFRAAGIEQGVSNRTISHIVGNPVYKGEGVVRWAAHPDNPKTHKCKNHQVPSGKSTRCSVCAKCAPHDAAEVNESGRLQCPLCGRERFVFPAEGIVTEDVWDGAQKSLVKAAKRSMPFKPGESKLSWRTYGLPEGRVTHKHDDYGDEVAYTMTSEGRTWGRVYRCKAAKVKEGRFTKEDPNRCKGFGLVKANGRRMTSIRADILEADVLADLLPKMTDPEAISAWVKSVDEEAAREFATTEDPATLADATQLELVNLDAKEERVADSYIEDIISKEKRNEKLAAIEVERLRLTDLLGRLTASLERREMASSVLDELLIGDVALPGLADVVPGIDVEHETDGNGLPVVESWGWSDVASLLASDAEAVYNGDKKTLNEDSIKWVRKLVEMFDIRIVIDGEEDELPTWTVKGSIPLVNPAGDSGYSVIPTSNAKWFSARTSLAPSTFVK